ncbi:MAG: lantibiotic dehydratase, partial [Ktedonobacteraceae bacterium]|nr:lantibiotic dehydratase [Ktedonobacteraceae bacterium]
KDWRLIFSADSAGVPPERALPLGSLILEECEGELVVRTRDDQQQFDLLEIFDSFISDQVCDLFKILAPAPHTPRITVDRLVVCRETWRFAPVDLPWAFRVDPLERYIEMRRWTKAQQMPRFFFVRTPNERKPFYVDLDSPIFGEIFAKAVRSAASARGERITITEMLPDPEHAWLPDDDGNRYTCEMRMVAVDQLKPPDRNVYGTR